VRVPAYDDTGRLVHEHDGRVWMGSLEEPAVAVLCP